MRVLITGGNGGLGQRLVSILDGADHDVTVGSRTPHGRDDGVAEVAYRLEAPPSLRGTDVVVHLASDARKPQSDVEGTRRLVDVAAAGGVGHLVYMSIVGIDRHPFPYYRAKLRCEQVVAAGDVPWTVLRSTQFHQFIEIIGDLLHFGSTTVLPSGLKSQPIDADRVARRLADLVDTGPSGRVADIGGPQVISVADGVRRVAEARGGHRRVLQLPLPGKSWRAFRDGLNLLGAEGEIVGPSFDEFVDSLS